MRPPRQALREVNVQITFVFKKAVLVSLFSFCFLAGTTTLYADDILPANPANSANTLFVRTSSVDSVRPAVYKLNRWVVEEKTDPVQHALEVYKKGSAPRYNRHIWLSDRADGKKHIIIDYASSGTGDKVLFSSQEDYLYYLGLAPGGENIIYGVNLTSKKRFSLGTGEDFRTIDCPGKKSYVVIWRGNVDAQTVYQVYTTDGLRANDLTGFPTASDLEKNLCR